MTFRVVLSIVTLVATSQMAATTPRVATGGPAGRVTLARVPDDGIQPQIAQDRSGQMHLIYFKGDAAHGDLFYTRFDPKNVRFALPLRVNEPGTAAAMGTVRGGHLAIGRNGRVHVAWAGSDRAKPQGPDYFKPMLYTRLNDDGEAFETPRNLVATFGNGLDGGSIAADHSGNVFVVWHAGGPGKMGEAERRVWLAQSGDDGRTFERERAVSREETGVCGCCGLGATADEGGNLYVLYRSATEVVHRDMFLLTLRAGGPAVSSDKIQEWNTGACQMSTSAFALDKTGVVGAWETTGQVQMVRIDRETGRRSPFVAPALSGDANRKHPAVAVNAAGETLLVWTEGTGWQRGGSVAWEIFDRQGRSTGETGRVPGVPAWGLAAAYARPDGGFTILY
jgi:hypothetical protein